MFIDESTRTKYDVIGVRKSNGTIEIQKGSEYVGKRIFASSDELYSNVNESSGGSNLRVIVLESVNG